MGLQLSQDQIPLKSETKLERKKARNAALTVVELAGYDPDEARPVLEALGLTGRDQ